MNFGSTDWQASEFDDPERTPEEQERLETNIAALVLTAYTHDYPDVGDAIGLSPTYFDGLYTLAVRYLSHGRYEDAATLLKRLLQLRPTEGAYYKALGACHLGARDYEAAEKVYTSAYFFDATDPEVNYYMGQAQYFMKQYEKAFDNMRFARVLAEERGGAALRIAEWATQLLERMKPLVSPEQAAKIDLRPAAAA